MSCYENLVMKTQMNYSRHYSTYASGGTAAVLSKQKPLSYEEQIQEFVRRVQEAECIVIGGHPVYQRLEVVTFIIVIPLLFVSILENLQISMDSKVLLAA